MKNPEATRNLQEATENRRRLQAAGADEATIARAISAERLARYEASKYTIATMAEGFRWNR